jgi:hypothetical protein
VQITLSDALNDGRRRFAYNRTYTMLDGGDALSELGDMSQYAIVVHGVDSTAITWRPAPTPVATPPMTRTTTEISMPALCGTIEQD